MQSFKQMFRLQVYYLNNVESQCICSVLMFHDEKSVKCSTGALHNNLSFQIFASGQTSKLKAAKTNTFTNSTSEAEIFTAKSLQDLLHTCE